MGRALNDLEHCGYLGLITAIERFDPTQGYTFRSFAVPYIRGEILYFLESVLIPFGCHVAGSNSVVKE